MSADARPSTIRTALVWLVAFVLTGPLLVLPVQAVADEWRSPALVPQRWGFRAVDAVRNDPLVPRAIANSLAIAGLAVLVAVPITWMAARALAGRQVAESTRRRLAVALLLPLLLPPLAVGEGLRSAFLDMGLGASIGTIVAAHLVFVVPYMILVLAPAFTPNLLADEEAASGLGATSLWRLRLVTLPAVGPNLVIAMAMGFVVSWSQYGSTLGVGGGIPTLPIVLLPFVRSDPQVSAALSVVFIVPALIVVALSVRDLRR